MGLQALFQSGAKTVFNTFGDITKDAVYTNVVDDGFDKVETNYDCVVIPVEDSEEIQKTANFTELLQQNDVIALVPGEDLTVDMTIASKLTFKDATDENKTYTIVDKSVDPAKALYILLLRK